MGLRGPQPDCMSCDCRFSDGCYQERMEKQAREAAANIRYQPVRRSKRGPGKMKQIAADIRNSRIDSGQKYYAGKEKTK